MDGSGVVEPSPRAGRAGWAVLAALGTGGAAMCVTTIARSLWVLMALPSGAEPPDAAIAAVPASILTGLVFIAVQRAGATRAGGFDILGAVWIALFGALGAVFIMRRDSLPPEGAWVFWMVGAMFIFMSLAALFIQAMAYAVDRPSPRFGQLLGRKPSGGPAYVLLSLAGAAGGIAAAMAIAATLGF